MQSIPSPAAASVHPKRLKSADLPKVLQPELLAGYSPDMGKTKTTKSRSAALVRAEHGGGPLHLTKAERSVLDEALRLGADLADEIGSKTVSYGRWLLESVFDNDASAALDDKSHNAVWLELVRRAGGPTLALSRRMLYVALQVASHDKQITDQSWQRLDAGRKELLLPIRDTRQMREAAQHVSKLNLSQPKTREYVSEVLAEAGRPKQVRLTGKTLAGRVRKMRESLGGAGVMRRVRELGGELDPKERTAIVEELEGLREVLRELARVVKRK